MATGKPRHGGTTADRLGNTPRQLWLAGLGVLVVARRWAGERSVASCRPPRSRGRCAGQGVPDIARKSVIH